jgi:hypothetical protein
MNGTREHKKIRLQFYTDEYANWERDNLGQVKISLEGIPMSAPAEAAV